MIIPRYDLCDGKERQFQLNYFDDSSVNCTSVNTSYHYDFPTPTCSFASPTCCILPFRLQVVWGRYIVYSEYVVQCLTLTLFRLLGFSGEIEV